MSHLYNTRFPAAKHLKSAEIADIVDISLIRFPSMSSL